MNYRDPHSHLNSPNCKSVSLSQEFEYSPEVHEVQRISVLQSQRRYFHLEGEKNMGMYHCPRTIKELHLE